MESYNPNISETLTHYKNRVGAAIKSKVEESDIFTDYVLPGIAIVGGVAITLGTLGGAAAALAGATEAVSAGAYAAETTSLLTAESVGLASEEALLAEEGIQIRNALDTYNQALAAENSIIQTAQMGQEFGYATAEQVASVEAQSASRMNQLARALNNQINPHLVNQELQVAANAEGRAIQAAHAAAGLPSRLARAAATVGKVAKAGAKVLAGAAAVDVVLDSVSAVKDPVINTPSNQTTSRDQVANANAQADQGTLQPATPVEPGKPLPDSRTNAQPVQTEKNAIQESKSVTSGKDISDAQTNQGRFVLHNLALWRSDAVQPPIDPPISVSDLKTNEVNNYPTNASLIGLNPPKKRQKY